MAFHLTRLPEMTAMVCAILEQPDTAATTETCSGHSTIDAGLSSAPSTSAPSAVAPSAPAPSASAPSPSASVPSSCAPSASAPSLVEVVHQLADVDLEALLSRAASGRAEFDR